MKTFFAVLAALIVAGCIAAYIFLCVSWIGERNHYASIAAGEFGPSDDQMRAMAPEEEFATASQKLKIMSEGRGKLLAVLEHKPFPYSPSDRTEIRELKEEEERDAKEDAQHAADVQAEFNKDFPAITPTPTPTPQPSPTPEMTTADYQAEAVKEYPTLGVMGSRFNTMFTARYRLLKAQHSPILNRVDWPMVIASDVDHYMPR